MDCCHLIPGRRDFLKASATITAAIAGCGLLAEPSYSEEAELFIVGPKKGYSPQIGTLVSMMAFMRWQVLSSVKGMSTKDLDFLLDEKANRIGALLLHLVAVEKFFQANTFDAMNRDKLPEAWKEKWGAAMELGDPGRKQIQGNTLDYYLNNLSETREKTLAELRTRDDAWLMAVDKSWGWGPTNNYCKWFHVTEHEANHNGQIKMLKSRLPSAKPASE
ncbi:MAG TPA: DUF664 domain-containing protein [Candidatus Acidoferrum sp.]|nr:DUF664 domain-containing protein [Candidatus Acidoferrum sp.]